MLFTSIQAYEYAHAPFAFGKTPYGSAFYMATGFHGFHVLVGTIFLIVCLVRAYKGHFTPAPAFRLRGGCLVLALRRRGVAVPVRRRLCLGRLGRADPHELARSGRATGARTKRRICGGERAGLSSAYRFWPGSRPSAALRRAHRCLPA